LQVASIAAGAIIQAETKAGGDIFLPQAAPADKFLSGHFRGQVGITID
jgi:hypothetical protein